MNAPEEDEPSFQPVPGQPRPRVGSQPAPAPRPAAGPAPGPLLLATTVIGIAVYMGLLHAGAEPGLAGAAAGMVWGLLVGAALPGWCLRLGDRLGISQRARRRP